MSVEIHRKSVGGESRFRVWCKVSDTYLNNTRGLTREKLFDFLITRAVERAVQDELHYFTREEVGEKVSRWKKSRAESGSPFSRDQLRKFFVVKSITVSVKTDPDGAKVVAARIVPVGR